MVIEVAEEFLGILVYIFWLFEKAWAQEVIQNLSQFWMILQISDMFFFDGMFNRPEISLQLRIKVLITLHVDNLINQ